MSDVQLPMQVLAFQVNVGRKLQTIQSNVRLATFGPCSTFPGQEARRYKLCFEAVTEQK